MENRDDRLLVSRPLRLAGLHLRNRLVGNAHASGVMAGGLPLPGDAEYWRRRAAGGAAMLIVGGTVVSPHSSNRAGNLTEAWRPEVVPGLALRAEAIRAEGAIAACQLVHLGRETLGADIWRYPVAPSPVRSPREAVRARTMTEDDIEAVVQDFHVSACHAIDAGFQVVELHAAHGYLLAQFISPKTNLRSDGATVEGRLDVVLRIAEAIRQSRPGAVLGIRLSAEGEEEAGLTLPGLSEVLTHVGAFDYVNVTVGVRSTYVRDMATEQPPLLGSVAGLRAASPVPILVSQGFRHCESIESALGEGADMVGVARPLIADPDFPRKILARQDSAIRPCVSCNEDCRAFNPVLLCSVNPELAPPGFATRPAEPLSVRILSARPRRVAIVGAGPAGLECAKSLGGEVEVSLFEATDRLGGQLSTAASAPHRHGWADLLTFYKAGLGHADIRLGQEFTPADAAGFDHVVLAMGAREEMPALAGDHRALLSTQLISQGPVALSGKRHVVVVDDGFGGWPCVSAVEVALAAGVAKVTVVTPAATFAGGIPPEARVQLLRRLADKPVRVRALTAFVTASPTSVVLRDVLGGELTEHACDAVVVCGERRSVDFESFGDLGTSVQVIGDAMVPRKVMHAVAEGRAAAEEILSPARA